MNKKISVKSSNSPLGGGLIRVYIGDKLVWTKRVKTLKELFKAENQIHIAIKTKDGFLYDGHHQKKMLRLV